MPHSLGSRLRSPTPTPSCRGTKASASPTGSSSRPWMPSGAACWRSASRRVIGSASGRRPAPSGRCCSSRAARVGAILVNVNPAYRPSELAYALETVGRSAARDRSLLQDLRLPRHALVGARRPSPARDGRDDRRRGGGGTSATSSGPHCSSSEPASTPHRSVTGRRSSTPTTRSTSSTRVVRRATRRARRSPTTTS